MEKELPSENFYLYFCFVLKIYQTARRTHRFPQKDPIRQIQKDFLKDLGCTLRGRRDKDFSEVQIVEQGLE